MITPRRSASRFPVPWGRARSHTGSPHSARRLAIEALEDRHLLSVGANAPPTIANPLPDITADQGAVQPPIVLTGVFRDPDAGDSLTYSVSAPITIVDVVARIREGAATTAQDESVQVDSVREILGTDSLPTSATSRIYPGLLYAHTGQDRSLRGGEHNPAQQSILGFFQSLGLDTHLEQFTYEKQPYFNVVAEKRGASRSNEVYVIGAHYDSYDVLGLNGLKGSPGADANASGVAAMMEVAYALAPYHFDATIRFVAFDRAEQGLFGSTGYVNTHSTDQVKGMISLDTLGYNPSGTSAAVVNMADVNGKGTLKSDLSNAFNVSHYGGPVTAADSGVNNQSDHVPFENAGYDAVRMYENGTNPNYVPGASFHPENDTLEGRLIDFTYLTNVTRGVTGYLCTAAGLLNRSDLFRATITGNSLQLTYLAGQVGSDGCTIRATDSSGAWVEDSFQVNVRQTNQAPVLTPFAPTLPTITEDDLPDRSDPGFVMPDFTVSSVVGGSISDSDAGASQGIAITSVTSGRGKWQFSIDAGIIPVGATVTWTDLPPVAENAAMLLRAEDKIRFAPDGLNADSATFTYRAWDQTAPTRSQQGQTWDVGTPGPASPFSVAEDTATLFVVGMNDAPVLDPAGDALLGAIAEDTPGNGTLVSDLIAGVLPLKMIDDVDTDALQGIAVTAADNSHGAWQYSFDGNLWANVGAVSDSSARLLASDTSTRLRFAPALDYNQNVPGAVAPTIEFRAWDRSAGPNGGLANTSGAGVASPPVDTSPFSANKETASITVWEVNDPPTRLQGTVADLTVGQDWPATPLGLGGVIYSPGGSGDEVGQTLTYRVTLVPPSSLGDILLADGTTKVAAATNCTLADLRGMQFRPAAGVTGGPAPFTYTVTDNGITNGVADPKTLTQSLSISVGSKSFLTTTVGMYDPVASTFYLRYSNTAGNADKVFAYGDPSKHWTPVVGDWNGNGVDGVGFFDPVASLWYLRDSLSGGVAEYTVGYGQPGAGWLPLVGDWDGNGTDTIGLFDPVNYIWYLRNSLTTGSADWTFGYGQVGASWTPIVGDWNGDRTDSVGFFDPKASTFYLRNSLSAGYADWTFGYGSPGANWKPLVGDWDANGTQTIGVYDTTASVYHLSNALDSRPAQLIFGYGNPGWTPLVGRWGTNPAPAAAQAQTAAIQAVAADQVHALSAASPAASRTPWIDGDPLAALSGTTSNDTSSVDAFFSELG